ncbi:MAG TPA: MBL fold metallo-hydrolase, partial [Verrucomicrobiales bacterium]|nr:MBL fold metallo-hydrolase [Verrucomicrobiales bacterium]
MSIDYRVLGMPGADNALYVEVDSGQSVERLLFDCGESCVSAIPFAEILNLDHLCFSHFHMDHVCGFDSVFRALFDRDAKPNVVWGPPGTGRIMHHRFQGFLWNLHENLDVPWRVVDISGGELHTQRFELKEAFATAHDEGRQPWSRTILEGTGFTLEAILMDHHTPSVAYVVREKPKRNIDVSRLGALGLKPGPWMKALKEAASDGEEIVAGGVTYRAGELRERLIVESPGDSIAYLTDFLLDAPALERLSAFLDGCRTLVCESQYRDADLELAKRHGHMTAVLAATLARSARAQALVLFHVS